MTTFPQFPRDLDAELFVPGTGWVPLGAYPLQRGSFRLERGLGSNATAVVRGTVSGELNNRDGRFSPRNPRGPYYGKLGVYTPFYLGTRVIEDAFARTSASSWGSTPAGLAYTTLSAGGTIAAADYNVAAGVGTHSVPAAVASRATYLAGHVYRDVDVTVDVSLPFTNVTGGSITLGVMLRGKSTSEYYLATATITTAEAIELGWEHSTEGPISGATAVTGLTHATAQTLRLRVLLEGQTLRMKAWPASGAQPYAWPLVWSNVVAGADIQVSGFGWVGLMARVDAGNSNAKPVIASWDNLVVRVPEGAGEITELPVEWDKSGTDVWTPFVASGVLQRLAAGTGVLESAPRRFIPTNGAPVGYWPLEGAELADALRPVVGTPPAVLASSLNSSAHFGKGQLASWLSPVCALFGNDSVTVKVTMPTAWATTDGWRVEFARRGGRGSDTTLVIRGVADVWTCTFRPAVGDVVVQPPTGGSTSIGVEALYDDAVHQIMFSAHQVGADVVWTIDLDYDAAGSGATLGAHTLQGVTSVTLGDPTVHSEPYAVGHLAIAPEAFVASTDSWHALTGFRGEKAGWRFARLCDELGIGRNLLGHPEDTQPMGPQRAGQKGIVLLEECTVSGSMGETRGLSGLWFRTLRDRYNDDPTLTLDYAQGEFDEFKPVDEASVLANKVTASRTDGGTATSELTTGRLSTLAPEDGGAGEVATTVPAPVATDKQLPHIAGWARRLSTVDESRYRIGLQLGNDRYQTASGAQARAAAAQALTVDDVLAVLNPKDVLAPDTIRQVLRGVTVDLCRYRHELAINTAPASPYDVFTVEDPVLGRLHASGSVLAVAIDDNDTALSVASPARRRWATTTEPYVARIGGEDITVTACADEVMSSIVAGTVAHGNNASVAPGLPAGHVSGNTLLCLAAIRNSGAGVPSGCSASSGAYTRLPVFEAASNVQLFAKIDNGAETTPTVTFTGGVANADTSAQIIKIAGAVYDVDELLVRSASALNAAAQNIAFPGLTVKLPNCLIIYVGWKADDWTSVAALAGATEIGEPDTTTGDDQGIVWDYVPQTLAAHIPTGEFVVTGGASAISRGAVLALRCDRQAWTVTRGTAWAGAHSVGDPVRLASTHALGQ